MRTIGMGTSRENAEAKLRNEVAALQAENAELKQEIENLKKRKSPKNDKQDSTDKEPEA